MTSGTAADGTTTYSVKIQATAGKEAGADIVKLDSTVISDLVRKVKQAEAARAELRLNTGIAAITFTSNAVAAIGNAAEDSAIRIKKLASLSLPDKARSKLGDRPVVDFSVTAGNAEITAFNGEIVKISVPYTPKANEKSKAIVVYYSDQTGNLQLVNGGYDAAAEKVNFQTSHFSNYALGYNEIKFNDVAPGNWYSGTVDYLAAREVVKGVSSYVFVPEAQVKRADFLYNIMEQLNRLPDGSNGQSYDSFKDVSAVA
ncbi:Endo-1,4-beta-xylanase A precursor [compost metagenome]